MARATFAARVIYSLGDAKPASAVPQSVKDPRNVYVVENPFTGYPMALRAEHVLNIVNGVAAVLIDARPSGRFPDGPVKRGVRELINPVTGNTFQVQTRALIKEPTA